MTVTSRASPDLQRTEGLLVPTPLSAPLTCFVSTTQKYICQKQGLLKVDHWLDLEAKLL